MSRILIIKKVYQQRGSNCVALGREAEERLGIKGGDQVILMVDPPWLKIRKLGAQEIAELYAGAPITREAEP